ncbi:MAG: FkbM family methyltransferase [Acidimicrobiales bacterium]
MSRTAVSTAPADTAVKQAARRAAGAVATGAPARVLERLGRAGLLPAPVWRHLPALIPVDLDLGSRTVSLVLPDHDGVARQLLWRGRHAEEWFTIDAVLDGARRGTVVDVGSNAGLMTVAAAAVGAKVFAFEPVPRSFAWTQENLDRNGLAGRCRLSPLAVADTVGTATFHVPFGDAPSSASLSTDGFRGLDGELIDVGVTTLDAVGLPAGIALVKIDVEGHEPEVLAGAEHVIATDRPDLVLEVNHDGPWEALDAWLAGHDYVARRLDGSEEILASVRTRPDDPYRNIRCTPAERTISR